VGRPECFLPVDVGGPTGTRRRRGGGVPVRGEHRYPAHLPLPSHLDEAHKRKEALQCLQSRTQLLSPPEWRLAYRCRVCESAPRRKLIARPFRFRAGRGRQLQGRGLASTDPTTATLRDTLPSLSARPEPPYRVSRSESRSNSLGGTRPRELSKANDWGSEIARGFDVVNLRLTVGELVGNRLGT
jgi:hypothetical protein